MYNYNYFVAIFQNLDEVQAKKQFLQLAHQHHPDKGGGKQEMQYLNKAYKAHLKSSRVGESKEGQDAIDSDLIDKVNLLIKYNDLEIEILGSWLWITGNTKEHRQELKAYGFFFSGKKEAWYYRKEEDKKRRSNGDYSLDEIRERHGSKFAKKTPRLAKTK
jgi:hypothetical protein